MSTDIERSLNFIRKFKMKAIALQLIYHYRKCYLKKRNVIWRGWFGEMQGQQDIRSIFDHISFYKCKKSLKIERMKIKKKKQRNKQALNICLSLNHKWGLVAINESLVVSIVSIFLRRRVLLVICNFFLGEYGDVTSLGTTSSTLPIWLFVDGSFPVSHIVPQPLSPK